MSHAMCGDRRPVSQLHSADDVPELMRRAMRSLVRAEELTKDLGRVTDAERDALRSGFLASSADTSFTFTTKVSPKRASSVGCAKSWTTR